MAELCWGENQWAPPISKWILEWRHTDNIITNTTVPKWTPTQLYKAHLQNMCGDNTHTKIDYSVNHPGTTFLCFFLSCKGNTNFRLIALENFRQFSRWVYCVASVLCWKILGKFYFVKETQFVVDCEKGKVS